MSSDDVIRRTTVRELVRVYQAAEQTVVDAFQSIAAAERSLVEHFELNGLASFGIGIHTRVSWTAPEDVLTDMRRSAWQALVERLELRRLMSVRRWEELQRDLQRGDVPEITEETVFGMAQGFASKLDDMLAEAVAEVFDWLRPARSKYKTNSEYEVPEKVVLSYVVESWDRRWAHRWQVNYRYEAQLSALENVFSALDGKGSITKGHYSQISQVIKAPGYDGAGETPYFRFRTFRNGNMHLWFLRPDLLARFNALAGGKRLRAPSPLNVSPSPAI